MSDQAIRRNRMSHDAGPARPSSCSCIAWHDQDVDIDAHAFTDGVESPGRNWSPVISVRMAAAIRILGNGSYPGRPGSLTGTESSARWLISRPTDRAEPTLTWLYGGLRPGVNAGVARDRPRPRSRGDVPCERPPPEARYAWFDFLQSFPRCAQASFVQFG